MSLVLTENEQERFDQIYGTLEQGQFYPIKDILRSKSFLRSFALDSEKMMSSGRDNAEEKSAGDAANVAGDENESCLSRGDPPRSHVARAQAQSNVKEDRLEEARSIGQGEGLGKGEPKGATSTVAKGIHIGEKHARDETSNILPSKKGKQAADAKKESVVLGLEASNMENPAVVEKLLQGFILPTDKEAVNKLDLDMAITRLLHFL
ncbi:Neurofilament light polypeptide like [Actinidia chinensis var. chinensis]|uniref:Neurofilament light polypeptide like n=1 Tax=Actinidia chinensis var. chinensis TaxID=1590841 RepID=A0A2R6QH26_ACTCC|nr:Neurofilament light polypeptide like [Actinidia chinensis var. chinensis]